MDDSAKIITEALVAFDIEQVDAGGLPAFVDLSAERAAAVLEGLDAAGIHLAPETDPELLRADVIRSIYRFTYLAAVITPAGLAWQFGHTLATSGVQPVVAIIFGLGIFSIGATLFGGFARAMKMFANPSKRQLRRMVARRDRERARVDAEEQRRLEQAEVEHQRSIAEMIDAAKKLGSS